MKISKKLSIIEILTLFLKCHWNLKHNKKLFISNFIQKVWWLILLTQNCHFHWKTLIIIIFRNSQSEWPEKISNIIEQLKTNLMKSYLRNYKKKSLRNLNPQQMCYHNSGVCLILNFQCILHIFTNMSLQNLQRWIITEWLWNFFKTRSQNGRS